MGWSCVGVSSRGVGWEFTLRGVAIPRLKPPCFGRGDTGKDGESTSLQNHTGKDGHLGTPQFKRDIKNKRARRKPRDWVFRGP